MVKSKARHRHRPAAQAAHPSGTLTRVWTDPRTGVEYGSRAALRFAQHQWAKSILRDFEEMVRDRTLGQPAWLQLPGETMLGYSRFRSYLACPLGPDGRRSIKRLAATLQIKEERLYSHSDRYHWLLRAKLYDEHLMELEEVEWTRERAKAARRQARLGMDLQSAAAKGVEHLRQDPDRLANMTPMEMLKMAETGQRVERLARGDSTAATDNRVILAWEGGQPDWAPKGQSPNATANTPHAPRGTLMDQVGPDDDGRTIEGKH